MKAVIIDDELDSLETTELLIEACCPEVEVVGVANDAERGIRMVDKLRPELVFLDISMPKMSGFELLEHLQHRSFELIFTTAHDEHALKAFQVGAVHYLLKPIDADELRHAIERVLKKHQQAPEPDIARLVQQLAASRQPKIAIPSTKGLEMLEVDRIIRCEADSNYTLIIAQGDKIVVAKTLKELEQILEPHNFVRVHHSHLINLAHLKAYQKGEGGVVVLSNGEHINVSRSRKASLLERIGPA